MKVTDWSKYPNFTKREFDCKHTGENDIQAEFMEKLQALRTEYDQSITVTSGYRSVKHPIEARKVGKSRGEHTLGLCCDIACVDGRTRFELVSLALKHGFTRIGIANNFIHIGLGGNGLPNNVIWDYQ